MSPDKDNWFYKHKVSTNYLAMSRVITYFKLKVVAESKWHGFLFCWQYQLVWVTHQESIHPVNSMDGVNSSIWFKGTHQESTHPFDSKNWDPFKVSDPKSATVQLRVTWDPWSCVMQSYISWRMWVSHFPFLYSYKTRLFWASLGLPFTTNPSPGRRVSWQQGDPSVKMRLVSLCHVVPCPDTERTVQVEVLKPCINSGVTVRYNPTTNW